MKNLTSILKLAKAQTWMVALFATMAILSGNIALAQTTVPEQVDVNINTNGGESAGWYTQPWVWVLGVAVFILLVIALTRNTRRDY